MALLAAIGTKAAAAMVKILESATFGVVLLES